MIHMNLIAVAEKNATLGTLSQQLHVTNVADVERRVKKKYLTVDDYGTQIVGKHYVRATEYLSDHLITQITHNDFGVSERILQPYMDIIGSSECSIRVVVRRHNKSNVLDRDCNFLKILYQFDDETILKHSYS